jgi:hypothetical protein
LTGRVPGYHGSSEFGPGRRLTAGPGVEATAATLILPRATLPQRQLTWEPSTLGTEGFRTHPGRVSNASWMCPGPSDSHCLPRHRCGKSGWGRPLATPVVAVRRRPSSLVVRRPSRSSSVIGPPSFTQQAPCTFSARKKRYRL